MEGYIENYDIEKKVNDITSAKGLSLAQKRQQLEALRPLCHAQISHAQLDYYLKKWEDESQQTKWGRRITRIVLVVFAFLLWCVICAVLK